jgi:streptogrisin D
MFNGRGKRARRSQRLLGSVGVAAVLVAVGATPVGGAETFSGDGQVLVEARSLNASEPTPEGPSDEGSGIDRRLDEEIAKQSPVIQARMELEQAALGTGTDGLATINADHDAGRLDLYWKGELPEELRMAVERLGEGITVVVHHSPYSWTEIAEEARRLLDVASALEGVDVVATAAEHDMSGVRVLVSTMPINPASVRAELGSHVPVRFEVTQMELPETTGWRWDDVPPWTGGAVIERTGFFGSTRCSTAFTARTADDSVRGVFSARHCGENESWRTPVGHGPVGLSNLWFSDIDVMGIMWPTGSPAYLGFEGRVYNGAHNSGSKLSMVGSGWSGLNDIVCTSGGFSGNNCQQRVIDRNLFFDAPFGGPLFLTEHINGIAAVGNGDSGGPVFSAALPFNAHGVISAIITGPGRADECIGWVPEGRQCSDWSLHAEIQPVLNTLNMQIIGWNESDASGSATPHSTDEQFGAGISGEFSLSPTPAAAGG